MPYFNKVGGHIISTQFSKKEQAAIDKEIQRQCAEFDMKNATEIDALILWLLHEKFGFGMKRLRRFFDLFSTEFDALIERYQMEEGDKVWLCTYKLKEYGVDIEKWNEEDKTNG